MIYDRVQGPSVEGRREPSVLGGVQVTTLYHELQGGLAEILTVVNGEGTLALSEASLGVEGVVVFDRDTGELR